jgi:DNA-directed RNA polymerase specialized sigma24 family protein
MASEGSVTRWLGQLQAGDPAAAQQLWQRYFQRLVVLARKKLRGSPRRVADEEDVALSAFESFCRRAEQGRFPQLLDRDDLWRLLVLLTTRKASHQQRDQQRQKRGGGVTIQSETCGASEDGAILEQIVSREPTPEFAAQVAEECQRLLRKLDNPQLEAVALARMEGYSVEEIAEHRGIVQIEHDAPGTQGGDPLSCGGGVVGDEDVVRYLRSMHQAVEGAQIGRSIEFVGQRSPWMPTQHIHQRHQALGTPLVAEIDRGKIRETEGGNEAVHTLPLGKRSRVPPACHPQFGAAGQALQSQDRLNCKILPQGHTLR